MRALESVGCFVLSVSCAVALSGCGGRVGLDNESIGDGAKPGAGADGGPSSSSDGGDACPPGERLCGASCVDTDRDPDHCGGCDTSCGGRAETAGTACVSGRCVVTSCDSGHADCDHDASNGCEADLSSTTTCGSCDVACDGSKEECTSTNGTSLSCFAPSAPRLVAPLSLSKLTGTRPTFRWTMPDHASFVTLDLCGDPTCATLLTAPIKVEGDSYTPSFDLPAAATFWRVHALTNGATSKTWQVRANARSTPVTAVSGHSVDMNADGYSDLVAVSFTQENAPRLAFFTYYGGPSGLPTTPSHTDIASAEVQAEFRSTAPVGDVNGDGYSDFVIRVCTTSTNCGYELHVGGPSGLSMSATSHFAPLDEDEDKAIYDVYSEAGDVNGDGYADVVLGSLDWNGGQGRVLVYFGGADGLATATPQSLIGSTAFARNQFGRFVDPAGDVNADGYDDLLVDVQGDVAVRVLYGGPAGFDSAPTILPNPSRADDLWGDYSNKGVGDVNGDGYPDVAISFEPDDASIYVYFGSAAGIDANITHAQLVSRPDGARAEYGPYLLADDFDGDGFSDILFGDVEVIGGVSQPSRIFVAMGGTGSLSLSASYIQGDSTTMQVGHFDGSRFASMVGVGPIPPPATAGLNTYLGSASGLSTTATNPIPMPYAPIVFIAQ